MAYRLDFTDQFEITTAKTAKWLKKEWYFKTARSFQNKLAEAIEKIISNPYRGQRSHKFEDVRSVLVTKHNRLYYRITDNTITFLELIELKQSPHRNKYE
jgi:plasmid stabilization system protein ParE